MTALKPEAFLEFRNLGQPKEGSQEREELLENSINTLSQTSGWLALKEFIVTLISDLDQINKKAMESGATFEDIGRNTVVAQLCKEQLQKIIDKVEDVRESAESGE